MKGRIKKAIARKIADGAASTAANTVGKSLPLLVHEVKIPDSIKRSAGPTDKRLK